VDVMKKTTGKTLSIRVKINIMMAICDLN